MVVRAPPAKRYMAMCETELAFPLRGDASSLISCMLHRMRGTESAGGGEAQWGHDIM